MGSLNKVQLIGHLGAKPELKYLTSGQPVCEMRMATTEQWTKDGAKQEKTEWHRIVAWGKLGENCAQYLDKGRQCYVEGKLQTRTWDDKTTGEKKYMTEIVALNVVFLGSGSGKSASRDDDDDGDDSSQSKSASGPKGYGPPNGGDDDIPF